MIKKVVVTVIAVHTSVVDLPEHFNASHFESRLESLFYRCNLTADVNEYGMEDYPECENVKVVVTEISEEDSDA